MTPGTIRVCLAQDVLVQDFNVEGKYRLVGPNGEFYAHVLPGERWQARLDQGGGLQFFKNGRLAGSYGSLVALKQARPAVSVLGGSGALKNVTADDELAVMSAGDRVSSLRISSGRVKAAGGSGTSEVQGSGELSLVNLVLGGRSQKYRGDMEFRIQGGGITLINDLPLEEYLYGVVPREMPASWPLEAQKAQAVAARSYALAQLGTYRAYGYDLLSTQMSQVYGGYNAEHPVSSRAVDETRGQVILCRDKPVSAFFHSSSGGFVENCQDVWRETLDFLAAKPDPYDRNSVHYNWEVTYRQEQLVNQLKEKKDLYNKEGQPERVFARVEDIKVLEKTSSGARVKKIRVTGQDTSGKPLAVELANADTVRAALGLKSALFELTKKTGPDGGLAEVRIKGSGYGHGLGMSQYGALGMAGQGYNYQDILKYYYCNIEIRRLD
ncbi:MAG: SpoIID/LytB domain-containing protein [Peptococcaceae bacterium]|nr:SpoIID/LytB domain-containing protein [Peptococcaceae bacterium]